MDELKLVLNTKFMRSIVSKILAKTIEKKFGCNVDIQISTVKVESDGDKVRLKVDLAGEMKQDDLVNLLKVNGVL